jgi:MFS family permease
MTFWAGTSYLLTSAVFQPFLCALSDIFGRREILLLSLSLFTLGTIVCCTASNFTALLAGRSIQGIGGGGIIAMVLVIFTDIIPLRQRPKYNGYVQMAWAFGTITGPLIGGAFTQDITWRWIFYLNFPFCGIGLAMVPLVVRLEKPEAAFSDMFFRVDWVGGFLFIGSTTTLLMAVTWGGSQFPWGSYQTLVPLLVGVAGCVVTILWEKWGAKFPFIRLSIFETRSAFAAYTCATTQGLLVSIVTFLTLIAYIYRI